MSHVAPLGSGPGGWQILILVLKVGVAVAGLAGLGCSAMVYVDTGREFWRASQCFGKFLGTTALLGAVTTLALRIVAAPGSSTALGCWAGLILMLALSKLAFEHRIFRDLVDPETPAPTPLNKTARLLAGQLGLVARTRIACGILGGCLLPVLLLLYPAAGNLHWVFALAAAALCLTGELLERSLFFTAVAPAKMPGGVAA